MTKRRMSTRSRCTSVAQQAADQAGRPGAGYDDPIAREELVVRQRIPAVLDSEPIDLEDLVLRRPADADAPGMPSRASCWISTRPGGSRPGPCRWRWP